MDKKTPLYDLHVHLGGKMVPFAGYLLPVQYASGVIAEHNAVRTRCGLFDVSHMGEVLFTGHGAFDALQALLTNDFTGMEEGRVRYSPMCNENGGVVDDLVVCKVNDQKYLLVVNAANKDKDVAWFKQHAKGDVTVEDVSDQYAQLALQGPKAPDILAKVAHSDALPTKYYTFHDNVEVASIHCLVSRTGYTGEIGYEIYCRPDDAIALMQALLDAGEEFGLIPCGLGARDTLRLEAGMPLYGHEMNDDISPLETSLGLFVKMDKTNFIGKQALIQRGVPRVTRVGLEVTDRGIVREHCIVYSGDREIGVTTSGTHCPFINKAVAMALINKEAAALDQVLHVDVRGRKLTVKVVPLPFYKRLKT